MIEYHGINIKRMTIAFLFSFVLSACTMKGYQVDLNIVNQNDSLSIVKDVVHREGYLLQKTTTINRANKYERLERYIKKTSHIKDSFFKRKEDTNVHVDLIYQDISGGTIEVWIYNAYIGNDPQLKPLLTGLADQIEDTIRKTIPGVKLIRKEGLTGLPFL